MYIINTWVSCIVYHQYLGIMYYISLASQPLRLEEGGSGDTVTHFVALRNAITALSGFFRKCVTNVT